jgi:hypothetical protein
MTGEGGHPQNGTRSSFTNNDPASRYTPGQLRHHEVAQALLSNPPAEGAGNQIWSQWSQNLVYHINLIHYTDASA